MTAGFRTFFYTVFFLGLLAGYLPYEMHRLDPLFASLLPYLSYGGVGLLLLGAALVFLGSYYLVKRGGGTPAPFDPPQRLVVAGPYRYLRHPMMAGLLAMVFGQALWFSSPGILAYGIFLFVLIQLFVLYVEEPGLSQRFGSDYKAYRRAVPAWLPRRGGGEENCQD